VTSTTNLYTLSLHDALPIFDLLAHRAGNGGQRGDGRWRSIELPPTVVADDERIGPAVDGQARVFGVHDAFQDQLAAPALLDPLQDRKSTRLNSSHVKISYAV